MVKKVKIFSFMTSRLNSRLFKYRGMMLSVFWLIENQSNWKLEMLVSERERIQLKNGINHFRPQVVPRHREAMDGKLEM